MDYNNKQLSGYDSGGDFWRDNAVKYGIDEAVVISGRYLDMQLKAELSDSEKQFCQEIFGAMYEATTNRVVPSKLIYPYDFKTANDRMEVTYFHKNRDMNQECACAIDKAIIASHYKINHYNLELAVLTIISGYGFERVNAVLVHQIQGHKNNGRYSYANEQWAKGFILPDKAFTFINSHAVLINDFTTYIRKLYADIGAERFALLGQEERGEVVHGYEIQRSIMVDDNQGFVIAHNPEAVSPWVCWQFCIRDGQRDYNWGIYGNWQAAINGYNARLFVEFNL